MCMNISPHRQFTELMPEIMLMGQLFKFWGFLSACSTAWALLSLFNLTADSIKEHPR